MLELNWVDYILIIILIVYAFEGYSVGFLSAFLDLVSLIVSFVVGLKFYGFFANILIDRLSIPQGFSNAIGFFIAALLTDVIIKALIRKFFAPHPTMFKDLNHVMGVFPGVLSATILLSFLLTLIVALPVSSYVKNSTFSSKMGKFLVSNTQGLEKDINEVFGGAVNETINFLTVEPKSNEILSLNFKTANFSIDRNAENDMFNLINKERVNRGIKQLVFDDKLRDVGRSHCKDMFERGYFSHYTLEGNSPFDRMEEENIVYSQAGENLALSPNTDLAMQGLMNSEGHKANILSSDFGRVGIGVIDGGIYGEMFCQEFTD
ncbi:MAG: CvpA family protein [Candidatus Levybacteria bacterium]|nr:CvpA family protein [Candidatus Levybacteria bacterium]